MFRPMFLLACLLLGAGLAGCQIGPSEGVYGRGAVPPPPELAPPTGEEKPSGRPG